MTQQHKRLIEVPRDLPKVDLLLKEDRVVKLEEKLGRPLLRNRVREALDWARQSLESGPVERDAIIARIQDGIRRDISRELVSVVNATGVILHTNLGRAPLGDHVFDHIRAVGTGFSNCRMDSRTK